MFDEFSLNRLLRVLYPTLVFLFTVFAWNTSGQVNAVDFHGFPKTPDPSWNDHASLQFAWRSTCDVDLPSVQAEGSCRIDAGQSKLRDEKSVKQEPNE